MERRIVTAALALALVTRLGFAFLYWHEKPLTRDEREYLDLAQRAATGYGLTYAEDADRFSRAPLYPLFLAAVLRVAGDHARAFDATPASVKIAQSLLGVAAVWLIAMLARRAAGARAAAVAACLAAVYPPLVWIAAYVFSESLYVVFALGSVIALGRVIDDDPPRADDDPRATGRARTWTALAGVRGAFAALTRPAHLVFVVCAAVLLARRRRPALAIVFVVATFAVILPWTARNLRTHHRVTLIAAEGGVTFWTGNHPLARGEGDLAANPALKIADAEFRAAHPGLSAEALEPLYYRAAFAWIGAHPFAWLALVARKAWYFWVPIGPSYRLHSARYLAASIVSYGMLLPFGAVGAWRLRRRRPRPRALGLLVASGFVTALIFMPQERFRIPLVDPALIVCAAALATKEGA